MHSTLLFHVLFLFSVSDWPVDASYAFYVGKDLTLDGSVLVGGTGEEVSSHFLDIFPAKDHSSNATISVGVTEDTTLPGQLISIPQVAHTFRYISMEYSDFEGFPAPLTNGGVNECGVAVRDVWSDSRTDLYNMTPNPQRGLQYSDLARRVLERAGTAREGVELIGQLIAEYGYADYGGNSHLIADKDEGWVVIEFAGGHRLWAAERLGVDKLRLYGLRQFGILCDRTRLVQSQWHTPFNIFNVYGYNEDGYTARDGGFKYMSQAALENATLSMVPVTEEKLMQRVRDYRISDDESGYGQVVSLRGGIDPDLIRIWNAPTSSVTAPFNPWWLGVQTVPPEYGEHRYLTRDAASTILNPDFQLQEPTHFAGRIFKQVLYNTCSAPKAFLPIVQDMLQGLEKESHDSLSWVENSAILLIKEGHREDAQQLLTFFARTRASKAIDTGRIMADTLGSYIELTGRYRGPNSSQINDAGEGAETVNCLVGFDPDQPLSKQSPNPSKRRVR